MFHWGQEVTSFPNPNFPLRERSAAGDAVTLVFEGIKQLGVLPAEFANVVKGLTVDWAWTKATDGLLVGRRCVAFMIGETIARKRPVKFRHQAVTIDFRDDGGGGDRKVNAIAFVETVLRLRKIRNRPAVHEHVLGRDRQQRHRQFHRLNSGSVDIDTVNILDGNDSDADSRGYRANLTVQALPGLFIKCLRIIDRIDFGTGRKDNRGGNDGTGKRPHSHFVDSRNVHDTGLPQDTLEMKHRVEPLALARLLLEPFGECLVKFPGAGPRILL